MRMCLVVLLLLLSLSNASADDTAFETFTRNLFRVVVALETPDRYEVGGTIHAEILFVRSGALGLYPNGTVTVTITGGPSQAVLPPPVVYPLTEKHNTRETALPLTLPAMSGRYAVCARVQVPDPTHPGVIWEKRSLPNIIGVFKVIQKKTFASGVAGGIFGFDDYPDAPTLIFPRNALAGDATITIELLEGEPKPSDEVYHRPLGRKVLLHVEGAGLAPQGQIRLRCPQFTPPSFPFSIHIGCLSFYHSAAGGGYNWVYGFSKKSLTGMYEQNLPWLHDRSGANLTPEITTFDLGCGFSIAREDGKPFDAPIDTPKPGKRKG